MFATLIPLTAAFWVTQSMPQITCEVVPEPLASSTLTGMTGVPGAAPTTPAVVARRDDAGDVGAVAVEVVR
jgi:hypothetical protein